MWGSQQVHSRNLRQSCSCSAYDNGQSSDILRHLTGQTKFDQTHFLYIIDGKVIKFLIENSVSRQFSILIISTVVVSCTHDAQEVTTN